MAKAKHDEKYQEVSDKFKDHHPEHNLALICEVYLPFLRCEQEIMVQTKVAVDDAVDGNDDEFSKILLNLVECGLKKHNEICSFLGVEEDDFILKQLNFLIQHGFLEKNGEREGLCYEITYEGRNFLNNDEGSSLKNIERIKFEYMINDLSYQNEELYRFFGKGRPADNNGSGEHSEYKYKRSSRKNEKLPLKCISHGNMPVYEINKNPNFVDFFHSSYDNGTFYDFDRNSEAYKCNILFYLLHYESKDQDFKIDIRHCRSSVKEFSDENIEEQLSKDVEKYCKQHPEFLENLHKLHDSE